ncbi:MAG: hypothetical protein ACOYEF_08305 [Planifilum sp.]
MELLILVIAFLFWVIQKVLTSEKETQKRKHRRPTPTPWRDPWGERTDTIPIPDFPEEESPGEPVRPPSPSAAEQVKEELPRELEAIGEAVAKSEEFQEALASAEQLVETVTKDVQPPLPPLKRKKSFKLEERLFTKNNLVRGIILREVLGPPPSRRHFQSIYRRTP